MTLVHASQGAVAAEANMGRWIVRCSLCPAAARPPFHTPAVQCYACGTVTEIVWPSEQMRRGVERLLMMRPNWANRNWLPHETLTDLMWENGQHGVLDNLERLALDVSPGDNLFSVTDTMIEMDGLPQIVAPPLRRAVGV